MKRFAYALLLSLAIATSVPAHAGNQSQNTVDVLNKSITLAATTTWQQVAKTDAQRAVMLCQNVGTTNIGFFITRNNNGNVTPTPVGIGSAGVFTMLPNMSYEPDGGWIPGGEIWAIGTIGGILSCQLSPTQPL